MSFKIDILDPSGNPNGSFEIPDNCIELEKGEQAVHDVVTAYLAGIRAGTASTKTRTEVSGGGAKPFRQKGTGRARAGSNRSPIWRHGGIIFGPKPRSYAKKVNKKVRTLALRRAFSERLKEGSVAILDSFPVSDAKTKTAAGILKKTAGVQNCLVLLSTLNENESRALANIPKAELDLAQNANVYQILLHKKVVFTKDSIEVFLKRVEKGKK